MDCKLFSSAFALCVGTLYLTYAFKSVCNIAAAVQKGTIIWGRLPQ